MFYNAMSAVASAVRSLGSTRGFGTQYFVCVCTDM